MAEIAAIQTFDMWVQGVGWRAEPCPDPDSCDDDLCVAVEVPSPRHLHPIDPLAFARWRVRARLDQIPPHVLLKVEGPRTDP